MEAVATANPGCLLQLINGCRDAGLALRVAHPITLLAEAYRREDMTKRQERAERLTRAAIIAVVRAPRRDLAVPLSQALVAGGVIAVEITTTTPDALNAIRSVAPRLAMP